MYLSLVLIIPCLHPYNLFIYHEQVSFEVYDKDKDGSISTEDLSAVLLATLNEHKLIVTRDEMDQIVEATFKEADPKNAGKISFDEYAILNSRTLLFLYSFHEVQLTP